MIPPLPAVVLAAEVRPVISGEAVARVYIAHCARGPRRCAKCAALGHPAWALVRLNPPPPEAARPVLQVEADGGKTWATYDVVREFADEAEARAYAQAKGLPVVKE